MKIILSNVKKTKQVIAMFTFFHINNNLLGQKYFAICRTKAKTFKLIQKCWNNKYFAKKNILKTLGPKSLGG